MRAVQAVRPQEQGPVAGRESRTYKAPQEPGVPGTWGARELRSAQLDQGEGQTCRRMSVVIL